MELSGKAKEKFEEFFTKGVCDDEYSNYILNNFYEMHPSMQYGVYVDFFDSVGILIETKVKPRQQFNYGIHDCLDWIVSSEFFNDRAKARTKAIEKANDLLNERLWKITKLQ